MKQNEVHNKIVEQSDAIDIIAKELRWILTETAKQNPEVGTPLGDEMAQKFFQLYADFKKVRKNAEILSEAVNKVKFTDSTIGLVYRAAAQLLIRRCTEGIFAQFTSVAETGDLPQNNY